MLKEDTQAGVAHPFEAPDYYLLDDLLTEEHKLIRASVRAWLTTNISPYINEWAQDNHCPKDLVKEMGEMGFFGPALPEKYG